MIDRVSGPPASYVRTTNGKVPAGFIALFAKDAVVDDAGRIIRGREAIRAWAASDIFAADREVAPRDALEDDGARHHFLLPRVGGRHSRHAASCNTARSSPLRPATSASTPTGLSWNKTAKNTHPAR